MRITIFGATGRTGLHIVEQALERGYEVTAFVRNPDRLGEFRSQVDVVQGDILEKEPVSRAVAGADALISVLGPTQNEPTFEVSQGTRHILDGMQQHGVRRLIVSAGAGVGDPNDEPKLFNKIINILLKLFSRYVYEDMARTVEIVRNSNVDWTVVRVPMLSDEPAKGDVQVGWVGKGMGSRITRADMAGFMLDQAQSNAYVHRAPAISN